MDIKVRSLVGFCVALVFASHAAAQAGMGGTPPGLARDGASEVPALVLAPIDVASVLSLDASREGPRPERFGVEHEVELGLENVGVWDDLPGGDLRWRLRLESPGAASLNLLFDRYRLSPGARLFVYNDAGRVLGAFTEELNRPHLGFATEPLRGDGITLEYVQPANEPLGQLRVSRVIHAFRDILGPAIPPPSMSGTCNINVNCPLGADWQDEKRAVGRVLIGGFFCTGFLMNNTADDGAPYFMTANHCFAGNPANWVFQFNYESPTCTGNTGMGNSVVGSVVRSTGVVGDHCLVEITQAIPLAYNVFFAGWSRAATPPTSSICIHHPLAQVKKISQDVDPAGSAVFMGVPCWRVETWEQGVTLTNSSGSPLFDQNSRVVGQLVGGQAVCGNPVNDYYAKFDISWNAGVSTWLDPLATNQLTMEGSYGGCPPLSYYCTAKAGLTCGTPAIAATGLPRASQTSGFMVSAGPARSNRSGLLLYSDAGANNAAFQGGTLCIATPLRRSPAVSSGGTSACDGEFSIDMNAFASGLGGGNPAAFLLALGTQVNLQWWGRDSLATGSFLSDAMQYDVCP